MSEPSCPSCGAIDTSVIGLEDGQLRYKCDSCLADWLEPNGPDLQQCENGDCPNWIPDGTVVCNTCRLAGIPL